MTHLKTYNLLGFGHRSTNTDNHLSKSEVPCDSITSSFPSLPRLSFSFDLHPMHLLSFSSALMLSVCLFTCLAPPYKEVAPSEICQPLPRKLGLSSSLPFFCRSLIPIPSGFKDTNTETIICLLFLLYLIHHSIF